MVWCQVDFFVSHSWSDDPVAKWEQLCRLNEEFQASHGREPTFWLDKVYRTGCAMLGV